MLSYHNDPKVKDFHVTQARRHLAQDMLIAGAYVKVVSDGFRGCSVGCMAHDIAPDRRDYHAVVAEHAGWPEWLVHLNDSIFEGLPEGKRETFHVDLREAVPVGVDLEPVRHKLALRRIDRLIELQQQHARKSHGHGIGEVIAQAIAALTAVRRCHEAEIGGNTCGLPESAWSAARSAWSAAWEQEASDLLMLLAEAA